MTSSLYRTAAAQVTPQLAAVRARYGQLTDDVRSVQSRPLAHPGLSAAAGLVLAAEARRLDGRRWADWLAWCDDDAVVWVPLDTDDPHAGADQSLFLDDRRRLDERIWRFTDPNAWALVPAGSTTRAVGAVEAWPADAGATDSPPELLVSSVLSLQYVRDGTTWHTLGRQVHRLRAPAAADSSSWRLVHKILLLPGQAAGTPHLGWLL